MSDDKNLAKRSFKAASWVLLFQFATQFVQIVLGVFMARLLSPDDYGVLGMLTIFWAISQVFINGGFTQALLQRKDISQTDLSSVFYYNMLLSFLCCFAMIFAAPYIADFYRQPILNKTIMVSAWTLPIGALGSIQHIILGRGLRQGYVNAAKMFGILISGGVALYLAWKGYGVWALVWQTFLATLFGTVFVFLFVRWLPSFTFSLKALGTLFQFGSKLLFANLLECVFTNIYNVIIGKVYASQTLGYYEQARRYSTIWPHSIQGSIAQVLFPAFSKIQDDMPRLKAAFKRALEVSVFAVVFPAFLLCTLSHPFIELLLTPKWLPCIPYWWLLTCTVVLYPIHVLNLQLLNARGRSDRFLWLEIIKKIFISINVVILLLWGMIPMLISGIVSSCLCAYLNTYYVGQETGYSLGRQLRDVAPYVLFTLVSCLFAWGCYRLIYPYSHWTGLIASAIMSFACYMALNLYFHTPAIVDLAALLGTKFHFAKKL